MREYMLKRYHERRGHAVSILGGTCVDCGCTDNLEFDHKNPETKSFTIAKMWSVAWDTFIAEVMKCELRCQDCHVEKSLREGDIPARATHGTHAMYRHHGCRCDLCREANTKVQRKYKRRKRITET